MMNWLNRISVKMPYSMESFGPDDIDSEIYEVIRRLKNGGYKPVFSCSGSAKDHSGLCRPGDSYILIKSFNDTDIDTRITNLAYLAGLDGGVMESKVYGPCIRIGAMVSTSGKGVHNRAYEIAKEQREISFEKALWLASKEIEKEGYIDESEVSKRWNIFLSYLGI